MLVDGVFADLAGVAALYRKFMQIAYGKVRVDIFGIECGQKDLHLSFAPLSIILLGSEIVLY